MASAQKPAGGANALRFEIDAKRLDELDRKHKLPGFASVKEHADKGPLIIARGKGVFVWDANGKQYLDGSSAIWNVNLGFGNKEIADAVAHQLETLSFHLGLLNISTPPAIELAARLASLAPSGLDRVFFTSGGSEANESVIRLTRLYQRLRGYKNKTVAIARIKGYHGSSCGAASLTGIDHFHEFFEPMLPDVRHIAPPYCYRCPLGKEYPSCAVACADELEKAIVAEGPDRVAFFIAEPVMGAGGVIPAPKEYWTRIREICDKYDVLMVADEVITGAGRTGKMFACEHWDVRPDIISCAKGISSGYLPLGAVGMRHHIAQYFQDKVFYGGLTYNSHPMGCAAALATIRVYEEDNLIENAKNMGAIMKELGRELQAKHCSVGAVRSIGLFGIVELVRSRKTRQLMAPFNGTSDEMAALGRFFREQGLYTLVRWNTFYTNPPLCINEQQLREAFAIIDKGLEITDKAVKD